MGVETPGIRQVIFDGMCFEKTDYAQMIGCAGRGGKKAWVEVNLRTPLMFTILFVLVKGCIQTARAVALVVRFKHWTPKGDCKLKGNKERI